MILMILSAPPDTRRGIWVGQAANASVPSSYLRRWVAMSCNNWKVRMSQTRTAPSCPPDTIRFGWPCTEREQRLLTESAWPITELISLDEFMSKNLSLESSVAATSMLCSGHSSIALIYVSMHKSYLIYLPLRISSPAVKLKSQISLPDWTSKIETMLSL